MRRTSSQPLPWKRLGSVSTQDDTLNEASPPRHRSTTLEIVISFGDQLAHGMGFNTILGRLGLLAMCCGEWCFLTLGLFLITLAPRSVEAQKRGNAP
jgi:hypothetical protein